MEMWVITGITIFWCYELLYLCRWSPDLLLRIMSPRISYSNPAKRTSQRRFFGSHPSHFTELALGLDIAIGAYSSIRVGHNLHGLGRYIEYNSLRIAIPFLSSQSHLELYISSFCKATVECAITDLWLRNCRRTTQRMSGNV